MRTQLLSTTRAAARSFQAGPRRSYSQSARPRHLMSIGDVTPAEFTALVRNAAAARKAIRADQVPAALGSSLRGKTVAMMMSKLSTRTRVSTEAAVTVMGGHPMFLGKNDIQLGVGPPTSPRVLPERVPDI